MYHNVLSTDFCLLSVLTLIMFTIFTKVFNMRLHHWFEDTLVYTSLATVIPDRK